MKKIFATLAVAAAMFAFVSCQSPVEKAKAYAEDILAAATEGNLEKATEIAKDAAEWHKSLTDEERAEADKALTKEQMKAIIKAIGSPVEKAKVYTEDIEAAVKAGNVEEATKLAKEAAEWEKSLTDAERVEVAKALGEELGF
jgi:hypothetical protein